MTAWLAALAWALAASAVGVRERRRVAHVARTGHEIRGPLSAARLALDGLEPTARVQAVELELRRAVLALDDLAAGRPLTARSAPLDPLGAVDAGRLLAEIAPAWHALAAAHGACLRVEPVPGELLVRADRLRLAQACANLVANALEHGGGQVTVRASGAGDRVRLEVADQGPGLPAPVAELVAAARGRRSARGHGLAIAAAIADRHHGRLTAAPSGRGARMVLDLPAARAAAPRAS